MIQTVNAKLLPLFIFFYCVVIPSEMAAFNMVAVFWGAFEPFITQ